MTLSPAGRNEKGKAFERKCAEDFRELGFEDAITTRAANGGDWCISDHGIDLQGTEPFAVQCKRKKTYSHISVVKEIQAEKGMIPLVLSKADNLPVMAVLPWDELKKLIRGNFN